MYSVGGYCTHSHGHPHPVTTVHLLPAAAAEVALFLALTIAGEFAASVPPEETAAVHWPPSSPSASPTSAHDCHP